MFAVDFNIGNIIFKNSGHVKFRKLILAEDNQKTCFTAGTVATAQS